MATPGFEMLLTNLQDLGITIFLHVLLFIAVYFGLLRKTEVLGDDEGVVGAASVALALLTTIGVYTVVPAGTFVSFFGILSVLLVLVLGIMILLGMVGVHMPDIEGGENQRSVAITAIAGVIVLTLVVFAPWVESIASVELFTQDQVSFVLTLAMIAILGYMVKYMAGGGGD